MTIPLAFKDAREWGDLVARVFSGDAPAEIVPPGIILASDLPEWWVLRRQVPWDVGVQTVVPAGGQFAMIQITVGPPTDQIAVVERLWVTCTGPFTIQLVSPPSASTSSRFATSRDQRSKSLVTLMSLHATLGATVAVGGLYPATPVQGEEIPIRPYIVGTLASGVQTALLIAAVNAATQLTAFAYGYQRRLRPEERQLD
jgi:hypothetical protein